MNNLEKRKKLANEAVMLIKEFNREAGFVVDSLFSSIVANEIGNKIIIEDPYENEVYEYDLTMVSLLLEKELYGSAPCGGYGLYDAIEEEKEEAKRDYRSVRKDAFIRYIGRLYYIELRVDEIYERLKEIEEEAKVLNNMCAQNDKVCTFLKTS